MAMGLLSSKNLDRPSRFQSEQWYNLKKTTEFFDLYQNVPIPVFAKLHRANWHKLHEYENLVVFSSYITAQLEATWPIAG